MQTEWTRIGRGASYEESEECHRRELAEAKEGGAEAEERVSEVLEKERVAIEKVSELLAQSVKWNTDRDLFAASLKDQKPEIFKLKAAMRKFNEIYDGDSGENCSIYRAGEAQGRADPHPSQGIQVL